jgi:hypothetical protein
MLAVIVILMLALLALVMLVTGGRKAARLRARRDLGPFDDGAVPYRSHAEASRRSEAEGL